MIPKEDAVGDAVYLPLDRNLFKSDIGVIKDFFRELFSLAQDAQASVRSGENVLDAFRRCVGDAERERRWTGFWSHVRSHLIDLARLPGTFLDSMADAFARETASRLAGQ